MPPAISFSAQFLAEREAQRLAAAREAAEAVRRSDEERRRVLLEERMRDVVVACSGQRPIAFRGLELMRLDGEMLSENGLPVHRLYVYEHVAGHIVTVLTIAPAHGRRNAHHVVFEAANARDAREKLFALPHELALSVDSSDFDGADLQRWQVEMKQAMSARHEDRVALINRAFSAAGPSNERLQ